MVSKASDDLPEPLGPVTTVNFPSGRSTSMPLRLFWRAPRISTHVAAATAATHFFSTTFEPTGDYPRCARKSQIAAHEKRICREAACFPIGKRDANSVPYSLFFETGSELF